MIGKLSGVIDYKTLDHVLIDVRGVGYIVYCSDRTLAALPGPGQAVALYTDMLVREDLMQLFGFPTLIEKEWHRLLMSVQGVGAKASLAILGALGAEGTGRAIALGDWNAVKVAKGIGPKTAQRVVIELKDKAPTLMAMTATPAASPSEDVIEEAATVAAMPAPKPRAKAATKVDPNANAQADALSALTNLGYLPGDAMAAVAQAANETPDLDTSALIRAALRLLAPKE
ncbi:Holliday junction branch migration protein RuvA [Pseudooceanicola sediminis]|uniref:Holliday junction branch migration complex subunit RuvA n=1 Tax=Pseudooceanicola sediminis TaxID=2211117 RepID=A0A399J3L1_9RHOB|nr:Holliday junction branch migration protein RuvA [Pseudooceanicola sediminis]KAA2314130.1 Holliday junction branch migration protein RuvA [Puniceibacterium sp. HSS470]RII40008.1 Holliday junction branch migration protein RuvA [Pseudooceanicola sediminis]|tara:strand:+ start:70207 stop:70893 length:687 start_codon:yes stop_codon:yes gene_type:complete